MPPDRAEGVESAGTRILVSQKAAKNVPPVVLLRCARQALGRRQKLPVNDQWQEPPVTDIDGQLVIMVLCVRNQGGQRVLFVERARYKPKRGR